MTLPSRVTIVEVGPRDGLQNEAAAIATKDKVEFVNLLSSANLHVIEVAAFVSPKWVPQMADAAEVVAHIDKRPGTRYTALVPNLLGLERAHLLSHSLRISKRIREHSIPDGAPGDGIATAAAPARAEPP